jgi:predicted amidohydrolase YtcJ
VPAEKLHWFHHLPLQIKIPRLSDGLTTTASPAQPDIGYFLTPRLAIGSRYVKFPSVGCRTYGMKSTVKLFVLAVLLASCVGHESEFVRSLGAPSFADWILFNGKIITLDNDSSIKEALAVKDGLIAAVGTDGEMRKWRGPQTQETNLGGRTVIPGLIDSHIHATVAGLSWDLELHWENLRSLAQGIKLIAAAAKAKPAGTWIVVGGGWMPTQFAERRLPTRAELDAAAPGHPVYLQILGQAALVNSAALRALGITRATPDPPGGRFERDAKTGEPTGYAFGAGAWEYVYAKIPRPTLDQARQGLRNCFRELSRLGLTSLGDLHTDTIDFAHRRLLNDMARAGELAVRVNFYIAPNEPGEELEQLSRGVEEVKQLNQSDLFRFAGFGEVLARGTGDGDVGSQPKGFMIGAAALDRLRRAIEFFAKGGHNFHLHATQDNTARQLLDVIEAVNRQTPLSRSRIGFAHLEDATPETIARIKKLGGGIAVQSRLLLTGETSLELWGEQKTRNAPPLRTMLDAGVPLGAGTDAFRSGNYSPMLALWWLVTGKSIAGTTIRDAKHNLTRLEALRAYTLGSAWFTGDEKRKGSIETGKFADLAVLNGDYLSVPEERIPALESLLTIVGGRIVYGAAPFATFKQP